MAEMKDLFNLFDIDGNGSITQELFNNHFTANNYFLELHVLKNQV